MDESKEIAGHEHDAAQPERRTDETVIHAVARAAGSATSGIASGADTLGLISAERQAADAKSKPIRRSLSGGSARSSDKRFENRLANKKKKKAPHRRVLKRTHANG